MDHWADGFARRVISERRQNRRSWYVLECGHVAIRPIGGKAIVYCAECIRPHISPVDRR